MRNHIHQAIRSHILELAKVNGCIVIGRVGDATDYHKRNFVKVSRMSYGATLHFGTKGFGALENVLFFFGRGYKRISGSDTSHVNTAFVAGYLDGFVKKLLVRVVNGLKGFEILNDEVLHVMVYKLASDYKVESSHIGT